MPAAYARCRADPLPRDGIYWDTSFVFNGLVAPPEGASAAARARHQSTMAFLERLERDRIRIVISSLLFAEFWDAILKLALRETYGENWPDELRRDPAIVSNHCDRIRQADAQLTQLLKRFHSRYEVSPVKAVHARALDYMSRFPLRSMDAVHISSGIQAGVNDFAVADQHFEAVDGITMWWP